MEKIGEKMYKQVILGRLIEYFKLKEMKYKKSGKIVMVSCPFCKKEPMSASIIPNTSIVNCFNCKKKYNLLDIAIKTEQKFPATEEEQLQYLKELLDIKVVTKVDELNIDKYLDFFEKSGFDLVPIVKDSKFPIEKDWTNKEHKDKGEWKRWILNGLNIGVKTGIRSGLLALDIDALSKKEKEEYNSDKTTEKRRKEILEKRQKNLDIVLKELKIGITLIQDSLGGQHYFYKYDDQIPKTHIDIEGINIDIESEGGYILLFPSKFNRLEREIKKLTDIIEMPQELKKFLLDKITVPRKTISEEIREDINTEEFKINPKDFALKNNNLEGVCNSSFIKLGGILRKQLNTQQTGYVLHTLNKHLLETPMDSKAITGMVRELDKYTQFDEADLAHKIMEYLKDVKEANRTEISMAVMGTNRGEDKKRVDKALSYLVKEEKVTKRGTKYELIEEMNWSGDLMNVGVPTKFKVPYFHDWAYLNQEDLIIIGSQNKYGKTTLAMNVIKRLVEQGIKPDYIYNESGGRYAKVALKLGMKNDDFDSAFCANPDKIILRKNKVVVFDWVKPNDFARTDNLFSDLVEKVKKIHGFMICFVQLRTTDEFFAKDQIAQFPALVCKYVYNNDEGTDTKFVVEYVREAKIKGKRFVIPCIYDWETHEVKTVYELEKEKKK